MARNLELTVIQICLIFRNLNLALHNVGTALAVLDADENRIDNVLGEIEKATKEIGEGIDEIEESVREYLPRV